jgi:HEPN domain-containing protein
MPESTSVQGASVEWLRRGKADLALAGAPLPPGAVYEDLCFHAQQAAEKALKAIYVHIGKRFRYTHDIGELLRGLEEAGLAIPGHVKAAVGLGPYAWEARYPGPSEPVTEEELSEAVEHAAAVVRWAEGILS